MFEWYDICGTVGVVLILITYFLLLTERLSALSLTYALLNLVGAALITVSLLYEFNFSAFIIEIFWMLVSVYGAWRALARRGTTPEA